MDQKKRRNPSPAGAANMPMGVQAARRGDLRARPLLVTIAAAIIGVSAGAHASVTEADAAPKPITLYYWPMVGRAGHAFWMLDEAGYPYEHISSRDKISEVASAFGADGTTFAPPIIVDGDFTLSQSTALCVYLGEKLGFDEGIPDNFKAMQHLSDLLDLFSEVGRAMASPQTMHEFIDFSTFGARFDNWMGNIERSIVGPHFYGEKLTYVDFYLGMVMEFVHNAVFDLLEPQIGDKFKPYPKINEALDGVRQTHGYKVNELPMVTPPFFISAEFVHEYGELTSSYDFF